MHPQVMLFDEPFSNLDYPGVRQVLTLMVDLHRGGQTVIVATHELEKVLAHADRLVVLDGGRIVRDGPPQQLAADVERFGLRPPPHGERWSWLN
jgi:biotin transport system ATP-binding protein